VSNHVDSFPGREFRIQGSSRERPEFEALPLVVVGRRVQVRLAEDDHANVGVQVDLS
jgi:hypothetical protein